MILSHHPARASDPALREAFLATLGCRKRASRRFVQYFLNRGIIGTGSTFYFGVPVDGNHPYLKKIESIVPNLRVECPAHTLV